MRVIVKLLTIVVIASAGIGIGVFSGQWYSSLKSKAEASAERANVRAYLHENIKGIEVGRPFPDVALWDGQGRAGYSVRMLLPQGGIVFFIAGDCPTCYAAIRALAETRRLLGTRSLPICLVVDGDPAAVVRYAQDNGYDIPIYQDAEHILTNSHGVVAFPAYFRINPDGIVSNFGVEAKTVEEIQKFLAT